MSIRSQKYAVNAFPKVKARENSAIEKEYRTVALNFPTLVLQAGLVQAVGFFLAKSKDEHLAYLDDLADVLEVKKLSLQSKNKREQLHENILNSDVRTYQLLTQNVLEASTWLKRYTQALLKDTDQGAS